MSNCTRPNIACVVGRLGKYTHNLNEIHWAIVVRLSKHLKGTIAYNLYYSDIRLVFEGFCDANWISDILDTKSTSEYMFTLGGEVVPWKFTKQTCNANSTMEIEFIASEKVGTKVEWLRNLLINIPLWNRPFQSILINCDNQVVITIGPKIVCIMMKIDIYTWGIT